MNQRFKDAARSLFRSGAGQRLGTSLSDDDKYPQFCLDASIDYGLFRNFRTNRTYTKILEHVTEEHGSDYLRLLSEDPEILAAMGDFLPNDDYGNPVVFDYPGVGVVSPSTLRYVKVLADLKRAFGSLDGMRIAEIGVGYGGQCRVVNAYYKPSTYHLVDIKPALALTQRYLDQFVLSGSVAYQTMNELVPQDYDLVISNYAFTELRRPVQESYFERIVSRAKRGYITYNQLTPESYQSYTAEELVSVLPNARIEEEHPLTYEGNCIIVWDAT